MSPLETYAKVVLHSGCALANGKHKWEQCPAQHVYLRAAAKAQTKLKSNGLVIGKWINKDALILALLASDIGGYNTVSSDEALIAATEDAEKLMNSFR